MVEKSDDRRMEFAPPRRRWGDDENVGSRLAVLESVVSGLKDQMVEMGHQFAAMTAQLRGRPSWAVTTIITLETSVIAALLALNFIKH